MSNVLDPLESAKGDDIIATPERAAKPAQSRGVPVAAKPAPVIVEPEPPKPAPVAVNVRAYRAENTARISVGNAQRANVTAGQELSLEFVAQHREALDAAKVVLTPLR